jgi:hypothetical protein
LCLLLQALVVDSLEKLSTSGGISEDRDMFLTEMQRLTETIISGTGQQKHCIGRRQSGNVSAPTSADQTNDESLLVPQQPEMATPPPNDRIALLQTLRDLRELHVDCFRRLSREKTPSISLPQELKRSIDSSETPAPSLHEESHRRVGIAMASNRDRPGKHEGAPMMSHDFSGDQGLLWSSTA